MTRIRPLSRERSIVPATAASWLGHGSSTRTRCGTPRHLRARRREPELPFGDPGWRGPTPPRRRRRAAGESLAVPRHRWQPPMVAGSRALPRPPWLRRCYRLARGRIDTAALPRALPRAAGAQRIFGICPAAFADPLRVRTDRRAECSPAGSPSPPSSTSATPFLGLVNTMIVTGTTGKAPPRVDVFVRAAATRAQRLHPAQLREPPRDVAARRDRGRAGDLPRDGSARHAITVTRW